MVDALQIICPSCGGRGDHWHDNAYSGGSYRCPPKINSPLADAQLTGVTITLQQLTEACGRMPYDFVVNVGEFAQLLFDELTKER